MVLTDESWSKDEITWSRQERESSLDVVILSPQDSLPSGILTLGVTVSNNSEYQDQDLVHEHVLQKVRHKTGYSEIYGKRDSWPSGAALAGFEFHSKTGTNLHQGRVSKWR